MKRGILIEAIQLLTLLLFLIITAQSQCIAQEGGEDNAGSNSTEARRPNFSWDHVPLYMHMRKSADFTKEELDYLAKGIDAVQKVARQGKIICMSIGLGNEALAGLKIDDSRKKLAEGANVQPRLEYCLAIFLICAEKYSYFLPHDGYDVNDNRSSVWLTRFPEYDKPLGPPKGPATKEGHIYTREFESASVFLDIGKEEAKITWK